MDQQQQPRWWKRLPWITGLVAVLAFLIIVICGYVFGWKWTGLVTDTNFPKRTLWDWLSLLIVPIVLALGGYLFTRSENRSTQAAAERRAQDDALEAYLDDMTNLMIDHHLRSPPKGEDPKGVHAVARARTLTLLRRLDGERKGHVVQFLYESGLITQKVRTVVDLAGANLAGANLAGTNLAGANLREADLSFAKLNNANLRDAKLSNAELSNADLSNADLSFAELWGANLSFANLSKADLSFAELNKAKLSFAELNEAVLSDANLYEANLSDANLSDALEWTEAQLSAASALEGTTMTDWQALRGDDRIPHGPTFEDWLRDRESRREDGENSGPS
jgi:hypothetical protein